MALIKNPKVTVIVGIIINLIFVAVKFFASVVSHVNLFFADAVDSFVDGFVIFLILIWLRFNLDGKMTFLGRLSSIQPVECHYRLPVGDCARFYR